MIDGTLGRLVHAARSHEIGEEHVVVACELAGLSPLASEREKLALAALVLAVLTGCRQGATRLEIAGAGPGSLRHRLGQVLDAAGLGDQRDAVTRAALAMLKRERLGDIIGRGDDYRPLMVEDGALYLQRDLARERRVVARVAARIEAAPADGPTVATAADLLGVGAGGHPAAASGAPGAVAADPRAPGASGGPSGAVVAEPLAPAASGGPRATVLSAEQLSAVASATRRPLTVLAGGPGTGKTATVAALVRLLARTGTPPEAIALAAPTGKAAHRMAASLLAAMAASAPGAAERDLAARLPPARTLHRLLGYQPPVDRFRHDEHQPIAAEVVIVDEASMIDLAMMDRLLRALPAGARLVLVGDPDQLPSVEAGSILADLVALGERAPDLGLVARLTRSYRMDPSDPAGRAILGAAAAVRSGRPPAVRAALAPARRDALAAPGAAWLELADEADTGPRAGAADDDAAGLAIAWYAAVAADLDADGAAHLIYDFTAGSPPPAQAAQLDRLYRGLERARVLCASRQLRGGVEEINAALHVRVLARASLDHVELYPGEPVIMRHNDYGRGLWNGDTGVVVRGVDRPGERHHFRAAFPRDGGWLSVRIDALRGHLDLAWALTVHQSQGSEYDDVLVILPPSDSPLASRELLYTALTRARRSALLVGSRAALDGAVTRPTRGTGSLLTSLRNR